MWNDDSKVNTTLINIVGFIRTGGKRKINKSSMKRDFFFENRENSDILTEGIKEAELGKRWTFKCRS